MRRPGQRFDFAFYAAALPLYAHNLGVLLAPLAAAAIALGLGYAQQPLFAAVGGSDGGLFALISQIVYGFAFAVAVIFADDAWRHQRGNLRAAWDQARGKAGNILIAIIGFYFLVYVAGMIGGAVGGPYLSWILLALAVWAFIYAIPAAAIGGTPGGAAFSASLQAARRHPLPTAVLAVVCVVVWYGLTQYVLGAIGGFYLGAGFDAAKVLLTSIALGYMALVVARQYADLAFRFW